MEVIDRAHGCCLVIDRNAREILEAQALCGVGDEHARNRNLAEGLAEVGALATKEQHRLGMARLLVADGELDLVGIVFQVRDGYLFAQGPESRLDAGEDVAEEPVARSHDEDGDRGGGAHLEVARVGVGLVPAGVHHGEDALACLVAHVGLAVDDARDRADAVAGTLRDVPDVHAPPNTCGMETVP